MSDMPQDPPAPPHGPTGAPTPPPAPGPGAPPPGAGPQSSTPPPPTVASQSGPPQQAPYGGPQQFGGTSSKDDNTMALLVHVSAIFTGFVGPLIIWLIKKDESAFVDRHGKSALNFQLTLLIAYFISFVLMIILIGFLTFLVCLALGLVFPIMGAIAANKGDDYTYPLAIEFIK